MARAQDTLDSATDNPLAIAIRARLAQAGQPAPASQGYQYSSGSPLIQQAAPPPQNAPSQGQAAPSPFSPPSPLGGGSVLDQIAATNAFNAKNAAPHPNPFGSTFNATERDPSTPFVDPARNDPSVPAANTAAGAAARAGAGEFLGNVANAGLIGPGVVGAARSLPGVLGGVGDLISAARSGLGRSALDNATALGKSAAEQVGQTGGRTALGQALTGEAPAVSRLAAAARSTAADGTSGLLRRQAVSAAEQGLADAARFPSELPIGDVVGGNVGAIGNAARTAAGLAGRGGIEAGVGLVGAGALGAGALGQDGNLLDAIKLRLAGPSTGTSAPNTQGQMSQPSVIDAWNAARPGTTPPSDTGTTSSGTTTPPVVGTGPSSLSGPVTGGRNQPSITTPPKPITTGGTGGGMNQFGRGGIIGGAGAGSGAGGTGGTGAGGGGGLVDQTGGQGGGDLASLTNSIGQQLSGIAQDIARGPQSPDVTAVFLSQSKAIMDLITQQEDSLRAQAQQDGTTVDPSTQFAIDQIKKQLDDQIKATRESLNSRGILESGITLDLEQKLRSGSLSDQAKILADRLSTIRQTLSDRLAQLGTAKINAASSFGMGAANAQTQADAAERQRITDLRGQLLSGSGSLRGQLSSEAQAQANRDFTAQQNALMQQNAFAQKMVELATSANDTAAQQQWQAQQADIERQFQQSLQDQRIAAGEYTQGVPQPSTNTTDLATNHFIVQVQQAPDKQTALNAFNQALQDGTFDAEGADPVRILNAINQRKDWPGQFQLPFGLGQ